MSEETLGGGIVGNARPLKDLQEAERTIRAWHRVALQMRDLAIEGDCEAIEKVYFDAVMGLPFYGADPDPLPSERPLALTNGER